MRNRFEIDQDGTREARTVRAIVASLCVLGLASIMWVHSGVPIQPEQALAAEPAASVFLPAPATPSGTAPGGMAPTAADVDPAPPPTF